MITDRTAYGFGATVALPFTNAVRRTTQALAAQGFGVLAEIDLGAALREKLGVEFREYVILGACRPSLAHKALDAEPDAGLLLPCNVVVYTAADAEHCVVAALDPRAVLALSGNPALIVLAEDAAARLHRAIAAVVGEGVEASTPAPTTRELVEVTEEIC